MLIMKKIIVKGEELIEYEEFVDFRCHGSVIHDPETAKILG